jgi:uncharacterized protein (TIGR03437 family)
MKYSLVILSLVAGLAGTVSGQPVVFAVLNSASYSAAVSPGCWVSIYGANLANVTTSAQTVPLSNTLGGVTVTVGNLPASLLYVSPSQVNALIPLEVAIPANTVVPLVVTTAGGSSRYNIRLTRNAPGIFTQVTDDGTFPLLFDGSFRSVNMVRAQDTLIFYATGLGPVDSSSRVVDNVEVYIGERRAQVLFAGLAAGLPGVYQVNVIAPVPATDRLYVRSGGWQSNILNVAIQNGSNTANVKGTIDGLNPSSDPGFPLLPCVGGDIPLSVPCGAEGFSIMLHAGSFSVSFDILPTATTFDVAAVGEAGGAIITIDPKAGTYTASITTLAAAARSGDFHDSIAPLWDYFSCTSDAVCLPFPGGIVPPSRVDPFWARAAQMLPAPSVTTPASTNALFQASGSTGGSRFVIDGQNNGALSGFGGIIQVPFGPFQFSTSTFKLYVDGKVVAGKTLAVSLASRCFQTGGLCWVLP